MGSSTVLLVLSPGVLFLVSCCAASLLDLGPARPPEGFRLRLRPPEGFCLHRQPPESSSPRRQPPARPPEGFRPYSWPSCRPPDLLCLLGRPPGLPSELLCPPFYLAHWLDLRVYLSNCSVPLKSPGSSLPCLQAANLRCPVPYLLCLRAARLRSPGPSLPYRRSTLLFPFYCAQPLPDTCADFILLFRLLCSSLAVQRLCF